MFSWFKKKNYIIPLWKFTETKKLVLYISHFNSWLKRTFFLHKWYEGKKRKICKVASNSYWISFNWNQKPFPHIISFHLLVWKIVDVIYIYWNTQIWRTIWSVLTNAYIHVTYTLIATQDMSITTKCSPVSL